MRVAAGSAAPAATGPDDEQVGAHAAQAVLALDPSAAVDDALQERLQQQLWTRFAVLEPLDPVLGVLAEELLERRQQLGEPQVAGTVHVPGGGVGQALLGGLGEIARDHLAVDRVGDSDRSVPRHQAQRLIQPAQRRDAVVVVRRIGRRY